MKDGGFSCINVNIHYLKNVILLANLRMSVCEQKQKQRGGRLHLHWKQRGCPWSTKRFENKAMLVHLTLLLMSNLH